MRKDIEADEPLRVDRWLWCARFYKTRSLAAEQVKGGHVRVNGQRVKPAHGIKLGDRLAISREGFEQEVTVAAIPQRRGPGTEAQRCYVETPESLERRRLAAESRATERLMAAAPTPGRPDKRTRRLLMRARQRSDD